MRSILLLGLAGLFSGQLAQAQVVVSSGGQEVRINADGTVSVTGSGEEIRASAGGQVSIGSGNRVQSVAGGVAPGANIEGVTIINGRLWIDGKEIPPGVKRYKSSKTGKTYHIERNGKNVSVSSSD